MYAEEAKQSGGSGDTTICQVQGMHGTVGGCARKGSCCLGWGSRGWRPKTWHWRRLLAQLMNAGKTRVGALALPSVTQ